MPVRDLSFEEINVGDEASFERTWTASDIDTFATLSGDMNPLHTDDGYAATTPFGKRVVHGALLAASISAFVGTQLPGKRCLLLSQNIMFKKPTFIGDTVAIRGVITEKSVATRVVNVHVTIQCKEALRLVGDVKAMVRDA